MGLDFPKKHNFPSTKRHLYALDKPTQEALLKAAAADARLGVPGWQDKAGWYLDQLKSHGMKVHAAKP